MSGVFISYRRGDSRGSAGRIYDNLEDHFGREHVFRDLDALEPGAEYEVAIESFISSCDAVVAVIGNQWLDARDDQGQRRLDDPADLVRREIEVALQHDKLVIPVLVEDADMPGPADLPGRLPELATRNALPISDARWDYDVGRLIQRLDRVLTPRVPSPAEEPARGSAGRSGGTPSASGFASSTPRTRRPMRTIGLVALGAVLALVVTILLLPNGSEEDDGSDGTGEATITLSPPSGPPGTQVSLSGEGFEGGETVDITVEEGTDEVTADGDGAFSLTFTIPAEAPTGQFEIEATGTDSGRSASATLEVS